MSICLELSREVQTRLERLARLQGKSVEAYLTGIVESLVALDSDGFSSGSVIFLSHNDTMPDQRVLRQLEARLQAQGCATYRLFSSEIRNNDYSSWASQEFAQLQNADVVVVLLSVAAVQSDLLWYGVQAAYESQQKQQQPYLLGVRVNNTLPLPAEWTPLFDPAALLTWQGEQDDEELVMRVLQALSKT